MIQVPCRTRIILLFQSSFVANGKLVAALCTAASEHFTAIGRFHALTKAMYAFAATIMWLECTFHNVLIYNLLVRLK